MDERLVWYLLVDQEGRAYRGITASSVYIPSNYVIDEFRDAVHAKNPRKLSHCDASDLLVYADKTALEADTPDSPTHLRSSCSLQGESQEIGLGAGGDDALLVLVPPLVVPPPTVPTHEDRSSPVMILLGTILHHVLLQAPTTVSEQCRSFKGDLCKFYGCYSRKKTRVRCMLLDVEFPKTLVAASHLFRRSNEYLSEVMMRMSDIDDEKNGLLLIKPLKHAFDHSQISFIRDDTDTFRFV